MANYNTKYKYCAYWGTWDRILDYKDGTFVEVNLTAINPTSSINWERNETIIIRRHATRPSDRDIFTNFLGSDVVKLMEHWMPTDIVDRLITEDFLPRIDWVKYEKVRNGGAPFDLIKIG